MGSRPGSIRDHHRISRAIEEVGQALVDAGHLERHGSREEDDDLFAMCDLASLVEHRPGNVRHLSHCARRHPECLIFGLPNDSGIAVNRGHTSRGNYWQYIQFITDCSWDKPEDGHHIKTRQGVGIEHRYADGRDWRFGGGDVLLRVFYKDGGQEAWFKRSDSGNWEDREHRRETHYRSAQQIISER